MIEKLEAHGFPSVYVFKFIFPAASVSQVLELLPEGEVSQRPSKNGKYISVTCQAHMESAAAAFVVYEKAATIPGMISL